MKWKAAVLAVAVLASCSSTRMIRHPDGTMELRNRETLRSHSVSSISDEGLELTAAAEARGLETLQTTNEWLVPLIQAVAPFVAPFVGRALGLPASAEASSADVPGAFQVATPAWASSFERERPAQTPDRMVWLNPGAEAWHWPGCKYIRGDAYELALEQAVKTRRKCRTCGRWSGRNE